MHINKMVHDLGQFFFRIFFLLGILEVYLIQMNSIVVICTYNLILL